MTEPNCEKTDRSDEKPVRAIRSGLAFFICFASLAFVAFVYMFDVLDVAKIFVFFVFIFMVWLFVSFGIFSGSIRGSYIFRNIVLSIFALCASGWIAWGVAQIHEMGDLGGLAYVLLTMFAAIFFVVPIASGMFAAWLCKMLQRSSASGRNENA